MKKSRDYLVMGRKLVLRQEAIAALTPQRLRQVVGGEPPDPVLTPFCPTGDNDVFK